MYEEEDDYEKFKMEDINYLSNLRYEFNLDQRFVNVKNEEGKNFRCQTPFLKVLKPNHVTLNKKKTIAKKYIILETNDELDFNNQIGDFLFIINKIHEVSQEKIKENSLEWFNTEFDEIGLDIKVKRPIDQQKESEFIRICLPNNKGIEEQINDIKKGDYVLCNIVFKGLKVSNDYITEEWELEDLMTQEQYEQLKKTDLLYEDIEKTDKITSILEDEYMEELMDEKINKENQDINENIEMSVVEVNYGEYEMTKILGESEFIKENNENIQYGENEIYERNQEEIYEGKQKENKEDIQEYINKEHEENDIKEILEVLETTEEVAVSRKKREHKNKEKSMNDKILENKMKIKHGTKKVIKKNKKILYF
jgi:hypothetical protein